MLCGPVKNTLMAQKSMCCGGGGGTSGAKIVLLGLGCSFGRPKQEQQLFAAAIASALGTTGSLGAAGPSVYGAATGASRAVHFFTPIHKYDDFIEIFGFWSHPLGPFKPKKHFLLFLTTPPGLYYLLSKEPELSTPWRGRGAEPPRKSSSD